MIEALTLPLIVTLANRAANPRSVVELEFSCSGDPPKLRTSMLAPSYIALTRLGAALRILLSW